MFLTVAWAFVVYNVIGTVVGIVMALPSSNHTYGDIHTVGSQAVWGLGTALSPPVDLLAIVAVAAWAASRRGVVRRIGSVVTVAFSVFYLGYGALGEITSTTSPLTGSKWDTVVVFDAVGMAVAALVVAVSLWSLAGARRLSHSSPVDV